MAPGTDDTAERTIRIESLHGRIDGRLAVSPGLRTLDELNVFSRHFLVVRRPRIHSGVWSVEADRVAINKDSILFVTERSGPPPRPAAPAGAVRRARAPVRFHVDPYELRGFLHVPRGADPMSRLNQDGHAFVALTSASVVGPDSHFAVPFLAVNRFRVGMAEDLHWAGTDGVAEPEPAEAER